MSKPKTPRQLAEEEFARLLAAIPVKTPASAQESCIHLQQWLTIGVTADRDALLYLLLVIEKMAKQIDDLEAKVNALEVIGTA